MKILLIGATGPLGLEVLKQVLHFPHQLTALVRRPDRLKSAPSAVRVLRGDMLDASSLEAAVMGQDVVISCFGTKLARKPTTLLSDGTANLVRAMNTHNVRRLICVTGVGAGDSKGHGGFFYDKILEPLLLHEIYLDKTRQENVVRQSGLEWVLVRPAIMTNGPKRGGFVATTDMTGFASSKISRADVASFLLREVNERAYTGKAPVLSYT